MLEECLIEMLGDHQLATTAMKTSQNHLNFYSRIQKHVLNSLNVFFEDTEALLLRRGVRLDYSKKQKRFIHVRTAYWKRIDWNDGCFLFGLN